jgi:hypothetical protein
MIKGTGTADHLCQRAAEQPASLNTGCILKYSDNIINRPIHATNFNKIAGFWEDRGTCRWKGGHKVTR